MTSRVTPVRISTAKRLISKAVAAKKWNMAFMMHSKPGVGKSAIVAQLAEEYDIGLIDVRLGSMAEYDVQGIPFVANQGTGDEEMKFSVPDWFPTEDKVKKGLIPECGIVFMDELSNAPFSTQQAAYRVILDREVHAAKMAKKWMIVAAGNTKDDKTGAKAILPALANRFEAHFVVNESLEDFVNYGYRVKLRPEILGFLQYQPQYLYDNEGAKTQTSFATPRMWEKVSGIVDVYGDNLVDLHDMVSAAVGPATASQFTAFMKYRDQLPDFKGIMNGKVKFELTKKDPGLMFAIVSSVVAHIIENSKNEKAVKNLMEQIVRQLDPEFKTILTSLLVSQEDVLANLFMEHWEVLEEIAEYVLDEKR